MIFISFFFYIFVKKIFMNTYLINKDTYQNVLATQLSGFVFRQDAGDNIRIKFFCKKLEKQILPMITDFVTLEEKKDSK